MVLERAFSKRLNKKELYGFLFFFPALIIIVVLVGFPVLFGIWMSFFEKGALSTLMRFVGFKNYSTILQNPSFWNAFKNTIVFTGVSLLFQIVLGMAVAFLLNQNFPGRTIARGIVLIPYLVPTIAATLIWKWIFNTLYGILNYALMYLKIIDNEISWLGTQPYAMISIIFVNVWKFFPFVTICVLAGLQMIPVQLYEAAKVDGASVWRRFLHITLPHLKLILAVVIILRFIWTFNNFDLIFLLTEGGPLNSTTTVPILAYETAFRSLMMGRASAIADLMFLFLILIFIFYRRFIKYEVS